MPGCAISPEVITAAQKFHGHWCPGLATGIRIAEMALREVGSSTDEEIVAVAECDNCSVDAVQFLTGCTVGKGNLRIENVGKTAFRFYRRSDGKAVRIVRKPRLRKREDPQETSLRDSYASGSLTPEEHDEYARMRKRQCDSIMAAELDDLLECKDCGVPMPSRALMTDSIVCSRCGEEVMETKTRNFRGCVLCVPCFEKEGGL
ncbi:MAG: FmdE family protein [Thermovirgaceae bacterium]